MPTGEGVCLLPQVGLDGSTTIETGQDLKDTIEYTDGMEIETGYVSKKMIKEEETETTTLEKPRVLVTDARIVLITELLPLLESLVGKKTPLLIIAGDVVGEALSGIILNINRGVLDMCAVKAPGFGDVRRAFLDDICTFTGATLITDEIGRRLQDVKIDDLGALDSS